MTSQDQHTLSMKLRELAEGISIRGELTRAGLLRSLRAMAASIEFELMEEAARRIDRIEAAPALGADDG